METGASNASSDYNFMSLDLKKTSSHLAHIIVTIDYSVTEKIRTQTIHLYKNNVNTTGLRAVPDSYIETNYNKEITKALHNFVLYHFVIDYIWQEAIEKKIPIANYPRLAAIKTN